VFARRGLIEIHESAFAAMASEVSISGSNETGGILLGYWMAPYEHAVITRIIGPGPRAIHSKSEFVPDSEWQERQVARIYEGSSRVVTYLGDWHDHVNHGPKPSPIDHLAAKSIADFEAARCPVPLMLILSCKNSAIIAARVYRYVRGNLRRCRLILIS
jgi:integrative and conjugative element protein (TIGR02256 family)